jgi:drug/metabolite transporter (DMT)-like permease
MIYIFLSILFFALNNVLWKKNLQECSVSFLVGYRALFTSAGASLLLLYTYGFDTLIGQPLFRITLGSIFGVLGLFCMLIVIKKAPLQWLGIYNLVGIIFTAFYLYLFENTPIFNSFIGFFLIIIGFVFYIYHNKEKEYKISMTQHLQLLSMTICFGVSSLIHWKNLESKVQPLLIIANQELVVFITAICISLTKIKITKIKTDIKIYFKNAILMAFIIFLALLFSFLGLKITNPLISSILFLATPLLTIILGTLFFKEKMSTSNLIAIFLIAIGAFLLHYQNN